MTAADIGHPNHANVGTICRKLGPSRTSKVYPNIDLGQEVDYQSIILL